MCDHLKVSIAAPIAGKVTVNGRLYTAECLQKAITEVQAKLKQRMLIVYHGEPTMENAVGLVNSMDLEGEGGEGKILLDVGYLTAKGEALREALIKGEVCAFSAGVGKIGEGGVVEGYELEHISIGPKP